MTSYLCILIKRGDDRGILSDKNSCLEICEREVNDSPEADCHGT